MNVLTTALFLFAGHPVSKDPNWQVIPFAREPDIVTPTGVAVQRDGSILVIESHTHFPLENYPGPKHDRVLRFVDADGDGKPESRNIFLEGTSKTMSIGVHPSGWVWIATRSEIFRIKDTNNDGIADRKEVMVRLETKADYPHNGLCGFAFWPFPDGRVYFGIGENFGEFYKLTGTDGSTLTGQGEGGRVFRCQHDGSQLRQVATGFWNPYHMCLDFRNRLFVVDNDPDERPPCRLLHVVEGGDFGYQFRNGRKGTHPFTAWNGELPGTLPMVAGTGEAPSGIVWTVIPGAQAPAECLIVTSWGDHRLERFRLEQRGASVQAQPEPMVTGGEDFRPVGIALTVHGDLIVSDWVDKSYNVHRKGRLWLIKNTSKNRPWVADSGPPSFEGMFPFVDRPWDHLKSERNRIPTGLELQATPDRTAVCRDLFQKNQNPDDPGIRAALLAFAPSGTFDMAEIAKTDSCPEVRAEALRLAAAPFPDESVLVEAWKSNDPFIKQAALVAMKKTLSRDRQKELCQSSDPNHRLAGLLLIRDAEPAWLSELLSKALSDEDPTNRSAALQTIAERRLANFRPAVVSMMESGRATGPMLLACLAVLDDLDRIKKDASDELRPENVLMKMLAAPKPNPKLVASALPLIRADHPMMNGPLLDRLARIADDDGKRAVFAKLRDRPEAESRPRLLGFLDRWSQNPNQQTELAAEAVMGLNGLDPRTKNRLLDWASRNDLPKAVRHEALRSLRGSKLTDAELTRLTNSQSDPDDQALVERLQARLPKHPALTDTQAWLQTLQSRSAGNAQAGRRVFFHPQGPGCFRCHRYEGVGGLAGPDLSRIGKTMTRERLLESILQPSKEIAPMYTPWTLVLTNGQTKTGLQTGGTNNNSQVYVDQNGVSFEVKPEDIESRKPSRVSIMPADLANTMTMQEISDLLAFLGG